MVNSLCKFYRFAFFQQGKKRAKRSNICRNSVFKLVQDKLWKESWYKRREGNTSVIIYIIYYIHIYIYYIIIFCPAPVWEHVLQKRCSVKQTPDKPPSYSFLLLHHLSVAIPHLLLQKLLLIKVKKQTSKKGGVTEQGEAHSLLASWGRVEAGSGMAALWGGAEMRQPHYLKTCK